VPARRAVIASFDALVYRAIRGFDEGSPQEAEVNVAESGSGAGFHNVVRAFRIRDYRLVAIGTFIPPNGYSRHRAFRMIERTPERGESAA
jgi:hypothetical protein